MYILNILDKGLRKKGLNVTESGQLELSLGEMWKKEVKLEV